MLTSKVLICWGQSSCVSRKLEMKVAKKYFRQEVSLVVAPYPETTGEWESYWHKGDCLYLINTPEGNEGYLFSTRAKGRYEYFDYLVIFSNLLKVQRVVITQYRSDHGGGICSGGWLKQFEGYGGGILTLGKDIDGVSGGTISATSLVNDMQRCHRLLNLIIHY